MIEIQEIHVYSRQTSTRNEQMPTRSTLTRMNNQSKDHIDPKEPKQKNCPKQLQTHNLPIDDVENINSTNKGRDLVLTTDCSLRKRKDAAKDPEAPQSYFT